MTGFFGAAIATFIGLFIAMPILAGLARALGLYTIVEERRSHVYVLFGKVIAILDEPGLYFLWAKLGPRALIVNWLGRCHVLDMRLDQQYLRSQAVNSEEGAPMGIGIWYEMYISEPVSYLFKNTDPQGSLAANVSNTTVRCLSNMPLGEMLETRHKMSQVVRQEVSPKSHEWGYRLGSVYIRKVHFRDTGMIQQIEEKVVNRLRQVTSAIKQDGANQVSIITSTAERQAAVEFARAQAMRPEIVGAALQKISADPEVANAVFEILETQKLLDGNAQITLVPARSEILTQLLAAGVPAALPGNGGTMSLPAPDTATGIAALAAPAHVLGAPHALRAPDGHQTGGR
jgi:regulator of protease activity HflC (stomatin/prohibitin superfamily)